MRISLASVVVNDQDKALRFYPEVLGFVKNGPRAGGPPWRMKMDAGTLPEPAGA